MFCGEQVGAWRGRVRGGAGENSSASRGPALTRRVAPALGRVSRRGSPIIWSHQYPGQGALGGCRRMERPHPAGPW